MNTISLEASNKKLDLNKRLVEFKKQHEFHLSELKVSVKGSVVTFSSPLIQKGGLEAWASFFMQNRKYSIISVA